MGARAIAIEITPTAWACIGPGSPLTFTCALLEGVLGSPRWMRLRSARVAAKRRAVRKNGKLGGRPRKAA